MVFGLENGLTVNKNLWNGDHVWQSVQLYVGGAKKKNKVKPLTWLYDWRIFELQFAAGLLMFPDAEMYVGLEWWFLVCNNVSIQVNCFNPWSARSGPLWSYVGQEFIHLHYNVMTDWLTDYRGFQVPLTQTKEATRQVTSRLQLHTTRSCISSKCKSSTVIQCNCFHLSWKEGELAACLGS